MNLELGQMEVDVDKLTKDTDEHTPKEDNQPEPTSSEYENQEKIDDINDEKLKTTENTGPKEVSV